MRVGIMLDIPWHASARLGRAPAAAGGAKVGDHRELGFRRSRDIERNHVHVKYSNWLDIQYIAMHAHTAYVRRKYHNLASLSFQTRSRRCVDHAFNISPPPALMPSTASPKDPFLHLRRLKEASRISRNGDSRCRCKGGKVSRTRSSDIQRVSRQLEDPRYS